MRQRFHQLDEALSREEQGLYSPACSPTRKCYECSNEKPPSEFYSEAPSKNQSVAPRLITVEQLAATLGVSKNTIYYWTSRNEVPYLKIGRHLRFNLLKVLAYFEDKTREVSCSSSLELLNRSSSCSLKTRVAAKSKLRERS